MSEHFVETYNGAREKRESCVFIRGKFYHKERDCVVHNGTYYSPFSRYLVKDEESGRRVHILSESLKFGVVEIGSGNIRFGYFSDNISRNCKIFIPRNLISDAELQAKLEESQSITGESRSTVEDSARIVLNNALSLDTLDPSPSQTGKDSYRLSRTRIVPCISVDVANPEVFQESISDDILAAKSDISEVVSTGVKFGKKIASTPYSFNLAYNSEVMMDLFSKAFNHDLFSKENGKREVAIKGLLGDFTYGVEYETWDGRVPTWKCAKLGLIPLRDGSLRHDNYCGYEYATVIMDSDSVLNAVKAQSEILRTHCVFNEKCSMHIHIGNITRDKISLERIFKAFQEIQDDMYGMFPDCLRDTSTFKQKSYCGPLPSITPSADEIVRFLSDGTEAFKDFGRPHPKDKSGQSKWSINSRYSGINLCNFYYTTRGTVEIRLSTPTFNHNKVVALIIISSLIIKSALIGKYYQCVEELLKDHISEENDASKDILSWMLNYVSLRKSTLNSFSTNSGSVKYFETFSNDIDCLSKIGDLY